MARRTRTVDPLISPLFSVALARNLKIGAIVPDETPLAAKIAFDPPLLPRALVPFVETLDFAKLAGALRIRPALYFHPVVRAQIVHLLGLRDDPKEWKRVGWHQHVDDLLGAAVPSEVKRVKLVLQQLVEAHVSGVFPKMTMTLRRTACRPGPKGGFANPYPAHPFWRRIDSATLYATWRTLRRGFETPDAGELLRAIPTHPPVEYIDRVVSLARSVVNEEPLPWSALVEWQCDEEPPADLPADVREWWMSAHSVPRTTADLAPLIAGQVPLSQLLSDKEAATRRVCRLTK